MARPLRIEFPGALYHVTSRGNARAPIFQEDSDRHLLLHILGEVVGRYRWVCHAFCLMTNHYHSVRAGLTDAAEAYPWSSLPATLGVVPAPAWLTTEALLDRFGSRLRYLDFVREGMGQPSPWGGVRGAVLGSDAFVEQLAGRIDHRTGEIEFPRPERLVHREPIEAFFPPAAAANLPLRNHRIRELISSGRYTVGEVGRHLGLHYSTVSRICARTPAGPSEVTARDTSPAATSRSQFKT